MSRQTYNAKELGEVLGVSDSKAYQLIRKMNEELEHKGFLICRGRVPRAYVETRFFGLKSEYLKEGAENECAGKIDVCAAEPESTQRTI